MGEQGFTVVAHLEAGMSSTSEENIYGGDENDSGRNMASFAALRLEVFEMLSQINAEMMESVCRSLNISLDEENRGNVKLMYKLVVRYLMAEQMDDLYDEGESILLNLKTRLDKYFKNISKIPFATLSPPPAAKSRVKFTTQGYDSPRPSRPETRRELFSPNPFLPAPTTASASKNPFLTPSTAGQQEARGYSTANRGFDGFPGGTFVKSPTTDKFEFFRLKEFRINGSIGQPGQKDKLTYSSLAFQIQNGKKAGYPDHEICAAVIKAISPDNPLRAYLEYKENLSVTSLIMLLRSHFKEKGATSVFSELNNAATSYGCSILCLLPLRFRSLCSG